MYTRQHYSLATGKGLCDAPSKTDIDARAGEKEDPSQHIYRGTESGKNDTHPKTEKLSSGPGY